MGLGQKPKPQGRTFFCISFSGMGKTQKTISKRQKVKLKTVKRRKGFDR